MIDPEIIDGAEQRQPRRRVLDAHAGEVVAPPVQLGVRRGDVGEALPRQAGRDLGAAPVAVELVLQQVVDRAVQVEGEARRLPDAGHRVQPEAARALQEQLDLRPAQGSSHAFDPRCIQDSDGGVAGNEGAATGPGGGRGARKTGN